MAQNATYIGTIQDQILGGEIQNLVVGGPR